MFRRPVARVHAVRKPAHSVAAIAALIVVSLTLTGTAFAVQDDPQHPRDAALTGIVKDEAWARILGKALFWDTVAGDNSTCAACHSNAGANQQIPNRPHDGFAVRRARVLACDPGPTPVRADGACEPSVAMSFARKLLENRPLEARALDPDDRLFGKAGPYGNLISPSGRGLDRTYFWLIRQAFDEKLWNAPRPDLATNDGARVSSPIASTQLEENFPLFWRVSIMLYEATLPSALDTSHSCLLDVRPHTSACYGEVIPRLRDSRHPERST